MSVLKQIKKWEKTLEHGPQAKKYKIFGFTFAIALIVGASVANTVRMHELRQIDKISREIQQAEYNRMQQRLEMIRKIKYSQFTSRT